jgi:hypothetical protein
MRRDPAGEAQSDRAPFWRWPPGILEGFAGEDDRAYGAVLQALARQLAEEDATRLEMDATGRRSLADIKEEASATESDLLERARGQVTGFRRALEDAYARSGGRAADVRYDGADPQQSAMADILIQYLVRTGNATVRTAEPAPGRYVYSVAVDWGRLRQLAEQDGHPLPLLSAGCSRALRARC